MNPKNPPGASKRFRPTFECERLKTQQFLISLQVPAKRLEALTIEVFLMYGGFDRAVLFSLLHGLSWSHVGLRSQLSSGATIWEFPRGGGTSIDDVHRPWRKLSPGHHCGSRLRGHGLNFQTFP